MVYSLSDRIFPYHLMHAWKATYVRVVHSCFMLIPFPSFRAERIANCFLEIFLLTESIKWSRLTGQQHVLAQSRLSCSSHQIDGNQVVVELLSS